MIRRLVAAATGLLGLLAGLWLMLAPFALGNQPNGAGWSRSTTVTVVTGGAVALIGLVGFVAATAALVGVARRYGSAAARGAGDAAAVRAAAGQPGDPVGGLPDGAASASTPGPTVAASPDAAVPQQDAGVEAPAEPEPVSPADLLSAVLPALVADLTAATAQAGRPGPAWSGFLHPSQDPAGSTVADAVSGRGRAAQYRSEVHREGA